MQCMITHTLEDQNLAVLVSIGDADWLSSRSRAWAVAKEHIVTDDSSLDHSHAPAFHLPTVVQLSWLDCVVLTGGDVRGTAQVPTLPARRCASHSWEGALRVGMKMHVQNTCKIRMESTDSGTVHVCTLTSDECPMVHLPCEQCPAYTWEARRDAQRSWGASWAFGISQSWVQIIAITSCSWDLLSSLYMSLHCKIDYDRCTASWIFDESREALCFSG